MVICGDCLKKPLSEYLVDRIRAAQQIVFTIRGAVAELERNLIAERVKAGLRNVRAKAGAFWFAQNREFQALAGSLSSGLNRKE